LTTPAILRRRRDPDGDRLATAIFVAALVHGLTILGLNFTAPAASDYQLPTLEVLLVPPGPDDPHENPDAAYIAQRTQRGQGTSTEAKRASLPEGREEIRVPPDAAPNDPDKRRQRDEPDGAVSVLARRALEAERLATGAEPQPDEAPVFFSVPSPAVPTVGLNASVADRELHLRGKRAADDKLLADTRESAIATYLDGWKRRIERVGTINFPNEARRRQLSGNPVVEVAIRANGTLEAVIVRRTSGHAELDNAAVAIVRLAAPFEPFPGVMRERFPVLRFAYEWQFINGQLGGEGAVFSSDP
jgi:periplasmic protein TonB